MGWTLDDVLALDEDVYGVLLDLIQEDQKDRHP